MNEKKEINIRAVEFGLRSSLELYKDMKNGTLPSSEEDKANMAQIIKNMCATVCEYVDNHNS